MLKWGNLSLAGERANNGYHTSYIVMEMCLECCGQQTHKEPVTESGVRMGKKRLRRAGNFSAEA